MHSSSVNVGATGVTTMMQSPARVNVCSQLSSTAPVEVMTARSCTVMSADVGLTSWMPAPMLVHVLPSSTW